MPRNWTMSRVVLILTFLASFVFGAPSEKLVTRVRLDAVSAIELKGKLIYGLGCLSHGCPEHYIARLEQNHSEVEAGHYVLLLYIIPPGGKHPSAEQLARYRRWAVELRRNEDCDESWGALNSRTKWMIFDDSGFATLSKHSQLPCFEIPYEAYQPLE